MLIPTKAASIAELVGGLDELGLLGPAGRAPEHQIDHHDLAAEVGERELVAVQVLAR